MKFDEASQKDDIKTQRKYYSDMKFNTSQTIYEKCHKYVAIT